MKKPILKTPPANLSRRRFVEGLVAGGALAGTGLWTTSAWAATSPGQPAVLSGTDFALDLIEAPVNFTGTPRMATTVNGQVSGPLLRWREGDRVTLRVKNRMPVSGSIHWHGILLPSPMDGVPGLSYNGIAPGETYVYQFDVRQAGTYWYHSHTRFQEQTGMYGPIIIEPREPAPFAYDRDYVVMLSDWTDENPEEVFEHLKQMSDYYNYIRPTAGDLVRQAEKEGWAKALSTRATWDKMRMSPRDLSDVSGATYTYLTNGVTPAGNWTGLFKPGEKVRLRFINGSSMTYFDVRIPGLKMTVVAADGQYVHPVSIDEFRIGVAETYDVIVEPTGDRAYTIFSQAIDRSGYALATLATRQGMRDAVPKLDPVPMLTMADMGMSMAGMSGMDMGGKGGMDMGGMHGMNMAGINGMKASDMKGMDMSGAQKNPPPPNDAQGGDVPVKHHAPAEYGAGNTVRAQEVSTRLDDPGAGLRDNGRRVLTYADLHTVGGALDPRDPTREIELHLTGNMDRYMWSFNGQKFSDSEPLLFHYGERLRIVLVNDTMMNHPIHMHGMWSEVESPDAAFQVRKHTVSVAPGHRITYRVSANARGKWAYHCHLLYHMEAGMFRAIVVA
ncbi:copper oxidase [Sulfuriferula plumbiphila]|uniref:Copper oxidase n=1 Tax=Sulfuriferula plumbiphila TaxID=171865 RepID=A0A512L3J4_9PROT|nr:copper resistance system multicopper oxidase [Sulfuriferula plumbiphila]BBP02751.1 copper oxidase [Sulfuriferula plumbiphila]GEP29045.1 copper oxidase [Sulfuriferula plumbiphila]